MRKGGFTARRRTTASHLGEGSPDRGKKLDVSRESRLLLSGSARGSMIDRIGGEKKGDPYSLRGHSASFLESDNNKREGASVESRGHHVINRVRKRLSDTEEVGGDLDGGSFH